MEEAFEDEPRIGGHDFVFVDELSPGQTCSICLVAMRSPVQTVCGHRFCESCLLETFRYYWHDVLFVWFNDMSSSSIYTRHDLTETLTQIVSTAILIFDLHFSGNAMIKFVHKIGILFLTEEWVEWNKQTFMMKLSILWAVACNEIIRILYLTFCA